MTALDGRLDEALAFEAPFVIDRLLRDRVAATVAEAEELFTEAKRYLVLCAATPELSFGMHSAMVDEAWHTFILFTGEYTGYGHRFFGDYLHHAPAGHGPAGTTADRDDVASFDDFRRRYEELFGQPLPAVWYDDTSLTPARRLINDNAAPLTVRTDDHTVILSDTVGTTILAVNELACAAVEFIAQTDSFYVRELPGGLTDEEKVALVAPLVRCGVLRLAP
ncbi:hypothetical protein B1R94_22960 [Mycolicibacterium litorale]|nr:hypothetical protein B1R94_22960 [Mycolicibacterium litorale]